VKERDPARVEALLRRGYHDVNWVARKYKLTWRPPQSEYNGQSKDASAKQQ
jgi:hypothetical protein